MVESHFGSQKSSYFFFFPKRKTQSQAGLWISWLSLFCGLVSKENWSFLKKARLVLKDHVSLSLKMKTRQSAASLSPGTGETHSQESLHPKWRRESERVLVQVASPGTVYKESQQSGTWHMAGMNTHTTPSLLMVLGVVAAIMQPWGSPLPHWGWQDRKMERTQF